MHARFNPYFGLYVCITVDITHTVTPGKVTCGYAIVYIIAHKRTSIMIMLDILRNKFNNYCIMITCAFTFCPRHSLNNSLYIAPFQ